MIATTTSEGVAIALYVQPRAKRDSVVGAHGDRLKVAVRAPARDNKANLAVLEILAKALEVPRKNLTIVGGEHSRNKRILCASVDLQHIHAKLHRLVGSAFH